MAPGRELRFQPVFKRNDMSLGGRQNLPQADEAGGLVIYNGRFVIARSRLDGEAISAPLLMKLGI
jgi:hypothetical protein